MNKILLVEDDPLLIDIYTTKLKEKGMEVSMAKDGDEALRRILEEQPDLILMDLVLPKKDGWSLLQALNESETRPRGKIIVLSNLGQREEVQKALELGAAGYLIKAHYTPNQVVEEVKKYLSAL